MNKFLVWSIFLILGILIGAVGIYVFSVYQTFNALASMEDAPFMQGLYMGFGGGAALMYEYYNFPEGASAENLEEILYTGKYTHDLNEAVYTTVTGQLFVDSVKKYQNEDGIYDWIMRTEERTKRGIFGFTVPIEPYTCISPEELQENTKPKEGAE